MTLLQVVLIPMFCIWINAYNVVYLYICMSVTLMFPTTNNIDLPNIYPVFYYCTNCAPRCTLSFYVPTIQSD